MKMNNFDLKGISDGIIQIFDYIAKSPFLKIIDIIIKVSLMLLITLSILNYENLIKFGHDVIIKNENVEHQELMDYRFKIDEEINSLLQDVYIKTGTDVSFIFEFHNGSNNLSGLPFYYLDMTYEQVNKNRINSAIRPLYGKDAWKNIPVMGFPLITKAYNYGFYMGDVEEIGVEDQALKYKLLTQGTNKIAIILLMGINRPIGFLGVSVTDNFIKSEKEIKGILIKYSQIFSYKLDADRIKKAGE